MVENSKLPKDNKVVPETPGKNPPGLRKMGTFAQIGVENYTSDPNLITQAMESGVTIPHWNKLFDLYLQKDQFSNHLIFDFVFRQVSLWKVLCRNSKRHKTRLDEISTESEELFKSSDRSKYSDYQKEIASVFYFVKKIMLDVEVVDPNENHLLVYFPKKPECFMLATEDKKNYAEECDISDSNTKMLDLMRNFNLFSIQMEGNMKSFRNSQLLYKLVSKDAFAAYNIFCWTFGLMINIFGAFWIVRVNANLQPQSDTKQLWLRIMSFFLSGFALFSLILWFVFRYP
jgi:hypothetical protein